ncbi:MAG: hypothetical protein RSE41_01105 [Clostridia bacterium]
MASTKSVKIAGYMQDDIRNNLLSTLRNKKEQCNADFYKLLYDKYLTMLPEDLKATFLKYGKKYFSVTTSLHYIKDVPVECQYKKNYYVNSFYIDGYSDKYYFISSDEYNACAIYNAMDKKEKEAIHVVMKNYVSLIKEINEMDKELKCALTAYNTTAKLRDEFPEAYTVYLTLSGNKEETLTQMGCDKIESLRAKLNKK